MAISYVGGQVSGKAGVNSGGQLVTFALTGGSASTPAAGDFVIVTAVVGSAGRNAAMAVTTPTGYTALGQLNQSAATADTSMNVSYKFMGSTPDTTVTIPAMNSNADGQAWTIQVFRGVDPYTPMDAAPVSAGGTGTGRPNPGPITPIAVGAWVVICGGGAAATNAAYVAPANFATNFLTTTLGQDTTDAMIGSGYWTGWTSGAVDPAVYTGGTTGATDSWASYTISLRPQVATRLYLHFDGPAAVEVPWTTQTFHPTLPSAKNYIASGAEYPRGLKLTPGTPTYSMGSALAGDTTNTTQPMSFYFGKCCSLKLGAQTIPVQNWRMVGYAGQTSSIGETYWRPCIYIWRPSTQSVVGFIANGSNNLGYNSTYWNEWPDAVTPNATNAWVLPVSGAPGSYVPQAITTQNGDMLIVELWAWVRVGQSATGDASRTVYFNAPETWLECDTTVLTWKPPDPISLLQEDFNAPLNPAKWITDLNNGSVTFQNGTGDFVYTSTVNTTHASLVSVDSFIFKDSSVYYKVEVAPDWGAGNPAGGEFSFTVESPGDNRIDWTIYSTNTLALIKFTNNTWGSIKDVSTNFRANKDTYRWLRFRETSGTTYFESAPSTASNPPIAGDWVIQHSALTSSLPIDPLNAKIIYRLWMSNPVAGIANPMPKIDGLNTASGAPVTGETIPVPLLVQIQTELVPTILVSETIAIPKLTEVQTLRLPIVLTDEIIAVPKLTEVQTLYVPTIIAIAPDVVLVSVLPITQTLLLPAVNGLGVGTNLFCVDDPCFVTPTAGTKATFLPKATNLAATGAGPLDSSIEGNLAIYWGGTGNVINRTVTIASAVDQSYYFGRFSSKPLATQTIPSQNWNWSMIVGEGNLAANTFVWPVMYVWRPGVGKVDPPIFDASAPFGSEIAATPGTASRQFAGAQVTTQEGDILVIEAWMSGTPTGTGYVQTWRVTSNPTPITSPYKIEFKPDTILYFQATTPAVVPTAGTKAANLPKGINTVATSSSTDGLLSTTLVQAPVGRNVTTSATVTQQSLYFGRHSTLPLAAQTIPAQEWYWGVSCGEINANANYFHWPVLYIWRPGVGKIAPAIFDANANYGVEWRTATDPLMNQRFTGASVTTQDGDILVCEVWAVGTQGAATAYVDVNVWTTAQNASLECPYVILFSTGVARRRIFVIT